MNSHGPDRVLVPFCRQSSGYGSLLGSSCSSWGLRGAVWGGHQRIAAMLGLKLPLKLPLWWLGPLHRQKQGFLTMQGLRTQRQLTQKRACMCHADC